MIEIMKIKTNLFRMLLDSGLFALNQRSEVAEDKMGDYTISDLLNNVPGAPVRVRSSGAVTPIRGGALNFDVLSALETADVAGEKRTGIMRFGQGMKSDALHDTRGGAADQFALMMKRIQMMARLIAESGVKDLALGLHKIMRLHSSHDFKLRKKGKFVALQPSEWADRQDMSIAIGIGSGGRSEKIDNRKTLGDAMGSAIEYQQQMGVQVVTAQNMQNYYEGLARDLGYSSPEMFFSEIPEDAEQPDPRMMQMQQVIQQLQQQLQEAQGKQGLEIQKINQKAQADEYKINTEAQLKQMQMQIEALLKREGMQMEAATKANVQDVRFGGQTG